MISRRPIFSALALFACCLLAVPAELQSQAAQAGQSSPVAAPHAGKVTIVLPIAYLIHDTQQTPAKVAAPVYWGDVINTGHMSRARVALDDGSILSVGSDSNMTVAKHDSGSQQTDLDLNFGRVRAKAVELAKPNAHFQIRTPAGVAGVVGTDFMIDYSDGTTHVVVFKGKVRLCAYVSRKKADASATPEEQAAEAAAQEREDQDQSQGQKDQRHGIIGPCIFIAAGAASSVRFDQSPSSPVVATPMTMSDAIGTTNPSVAGAAAGAGIGAGTATIVGVTTAVAVTVATVVIRSVSKTPVCSNSTTTTGIRSAQNCKGITNGAMPGPHQ
jgi:hypothetical protein